jgi:drug/metabolite transporter (DMT)-like permease
VLSVLCALLAAATNAFASVLQRKANLEEVQANRNGLAGLVDLLRQPLWLTAIGAIIVSFVLQGVALSNGELALVQPLMALDLPLALLFASLIFRRPLAPRVWGHIAVMTLGMCVFLAALAPSGGSPDAADGLDWVVAAGSTGTAVLLFAAAAVMVSGVRRAALLGICAGISFALTAVFLSATLADGLSAETFTRWQTYLVVVSGLAAMVFLQEALRAGPLVAVQPGVTLSDPLVSVILGVLLFDEDVRSGPWVVVEILAAAAVVWGVVQLSRSPAPSGAEDGSGDEPGPDDASRAAVRERNTSERG